MKSEKGQNHDLSHRCVVGDAGCLIKSESEERSTDDTQLYMCGWPIGSGHSVGINRPLEVLQA